MAKNNEEPESWTPDKPLPDADDEAEVQSTFAKRQRLKHLEEEAEAGNKKKKKRSGGSWLG